MHNLKTIFDVFGEYYEKRNKFSAVSWQDLEIGKMMSQTDAIISRLKKHK